MVLQPFFHSIGSQVFKQNKSLSIPLLWGSKVIEYPFPFPPTHPLWFMIIFLRNIINYTGHNVKEMWKKKWLFPLDLTFWGFLIVSNMLFLFVFNYTHFYNKGLKIPRGLPRSSSTLDPDTTKIQGLTRHHLL